MSNILLFLFSAPAWDPSRWRKIRQGSGGTLLLTHVVLQNISKDKIWMKCFLISFLANPRTGRELDILEKRELPQFYQRKVWWLWTGVSYCSFASETFWYTFPFCTSSSHWFHQNQSQTFWDDYRSTLLLFHEDSTPNTSGAMSVKRNVATIFSLIGNTLPSRERKITPYITGFMWFVSDW